MHHLSQVLFHCFVRAKVVQRLSRCVIDCLLDRVDLFVCQDGEICVSGQVSSDDAVAVFHPSFLVGSVRITEEGLNAVIVTNIHMIHSFAPVIKGHRLEEIDW